jgi:glycosyltransferase involved in cell wall biosynthesis
MVRNFQISSFMNTGRGITVIIPTYNSEKFLKEAITSVLQQEYNEQIEIIISDDGSCDNSLSIASSFGKKVKILRKPQDCSSQGAAGARNRGIAAASQPFICFLDSDDFYLKGHLKSLSNLFKRNPNIGFGFSRVLECKKINGETLYRQWTYPKVTKKDIRNPVVSRGHIVHTNSFMFRREVFEKTGVFNETYANGEDGDMWIRISELYKGSFANHYGTVYRSDHSDRQLTKNHEEKIMDASLSIFTNAENRYYQLNLKDSFRIFKIKQTILYIKYSDYKRLYHFNYIKLILKYPISVWYIALDYFHNQRKNKNLIFKQLSYFVK